jgi:hypothetical protein
MWLAPSLAFFFSERQIAVYLDASRLVALDVETLLL